MLIGLPEKGRGAESRHAAGRTCSREGCSRSSPPITARPPAGCTQRPRSDIPCTTPHHRQGEQVTVERVPIVSGQNPVADGEADDYFCPVCGIGLSNPTSTRRRTITTVPSAAHARPPRWVAEARALARAQDAVMGARPGFDPRRNVSDGRSLVPRCRLLGPCSRRLDGEVRICLGEVQHDLCLGIVFDFRHELGDLLRDCLPSPRSHLRCL
jgi:hypothetical protein